MTEVKEKVDTLKQAQGVPFFRKEELKDPVLKSDVARFDRIVPGWTQGKWWWAPDVGFIYEFQRNGTVVTITDRQLWGGGK
jgi:hypothetical protein